MVCVHLHVCVLVCVRDCEVIAVLKKLIIGSHSELKTLEFWWPV